MSFARNTNGTNNASSSDAFAEFKRNGLGDLALQAALASAAVAFSTLKLLAATFSFFWDQESGLQAGFIYSIPFGVLFAVGVVFLKSIVSTSLKLRAHYSEERSPVRICAISSALAAIYTCSCFFAIWNIFYARSFWAYLMFLSVFHFLEFILTAMFHSETLTIDSFLLNHSKQYHFAALCATIEYWMELAFYPSLKSNMILILMGIILCSVGQIFRTGAMYQAGHNFTHLVSTVKNHKHRLVTSGLYSLSRHPSYFGWFWWSIGTQIILSNPICLVGYTWASWNFFANRIPYEEEHLVHFFGIEYIKYRDSVGVGIPFLNSVSSPKLNSPLKDLSLS